MKFLLIPCLVGLSLLYVLQGTPTPVRGPTPIIQPLTIDSPDDRLTVLNESQVLVVNMIPRDQSDEHSQDSEPFLAVNRTIVKANATLMVGAALRGANQPTGATPLILLSNDGGKTWRSKSLLPSNQIAAQTYCFSGKQNSFYGSLMTVDGSERTVSVFHAEDPETAGTLESISTLSSGAQFGDTPFIQVGTFGAPPAAGQPDPRIDRIYVGQNYFGFTGQQKNRTASIRVSVDNPYNFKLFGIEARDTGDVGQDGPAVRPSVANDGTVYVAFQHWSAHDGNGVRGDVVVTRDDNWAADPGPFRKLVDPTDGLPGRIVSRNSLFSREQLGKHRILSPLSLAVDPLHSDNVYIAWGDYDSEKKTHNLHVRKSSDRGQNWSQDLLEIHSATSPALAVSDSGVVGFLYQQLIAANQDGPERWETHFQVRADAAANWVDMRLASLPAAVEPKSESDLSVGYRSHLLSVDNNFYGIFSAPNMPNQKYFDQGVSFQRNYRKDQLVSTDEKHEVPVSIDPYFFRVNVTPQSGTVLAAIASPNNDSYSFRANLPSYSVFLAVLAFVLLSVFPVVYARRLFKTKVAVPGLALTNYSGYVVLQITDFDGVPLELDSSVSAFRLNVKFTKSRPEGETADEIKLTGGTDAREVIFTIIIDSLDYDPKPDHITDAVPTKGTREFTFDLRRSEASDGQSLFVQIYQRTQLVQVVSLRPTGALRKSASV